MEPSRLAAAVALEYYDRYRRPLFISETSRVSSRAVAWLNEQWEETSALVSLGVPVQGFTWFPLGDVIDWRHALREKRGDVDAIGLYDMRREARSVAGAYAALVARVGPPQAERGRRRIAPSNVGAPAPS